jgi:hypothetical protein
MEQMTTHIGIAPGNGLVGRFGDTVILIPGGADDAVSELLDVAAAVASDRQQPASMIAARLATWVIGRMPEDVTAFGIVTPVPDGAVVFLRGPVWCAVTEGDSTRELSGEQALTWVDQIVPGTFERLAVGSAAGRAVQADPMSDLRAGVVPGHGFVLTRRGRAPGREPAPGPAQVHSVAPSSPVPVRSPGPEIPRRAPAAAWASPEDRRRTFAFEPGGQADAGDDNGAFVPVIEEVPASAELPVAEWPSDRPLRPYRPR